MQGVSQSLSGRVAVLSLLPLSLGESHQSGANPTDLEFILENLFSYPTRKADPKPKHSSIPLEDWILRGGYPEIRLHPAG